MFRAFEIVIRILQLFKITFLKWKFQYQIGAVVEQRQSQVQGFKTQSPLTLGKRRYNKKVVTYKIILNLRLFVSVSSVLFYILYFSQRRTPLQNNIQTNNSVTQHNHNVVFILVLWWVSLCWDSLWLSNTCGLCYKNMTIVNDDCHEWYLYHKCSLGA